MREIASTIHYSRKQASVSGSRWLQLKADPICNVPSCISKLAHAQRRLKGTSSIVEMWLEEEEAALVGL